MRITKYKIHPYDTEQKIEIPKVHTILSIREIDSEVFIDALVDNSSGSKIYNIIPSDSKYIKEDAVFIGRLSHSNGLVIYYFLREYD